jgi:hypothetical protein
MYYVDKICLIVIIIKKLSLLYYLYTFDIHLRSYNVYVIT